MATFRDPERHRGRSSVGWRERDMTDCTTDEVPEIKVWVLSDCGWLVRRWARHRRRGCWAELRRDATDHVPTIDDPLALVVEQPELVYQPHRPCRAPPHHICTLRLAMEAPRPSSPTGPANHRLSSQGPDPVASAHLACPGHLQRPPDTQHQPKPPSTHPRPLISTEGWDIKSIIASSPNFHPVKRVHYTSPNARVEIVIPEVEGDGNPLIITGWNRHPKWPKSLFNIDWLNKNGDQSEPLPSPRGFSLIPAPKIQPSEMYTTGLISRLLWTTSSKNCMRARHMQPQMVSLNICNPRTASKRLTSPLEEERLYGKDGDCPTAWTEWLAQSGAIPENLLFHGSNDFLKFLPDEVCCRPTFPFSPPHWFRPRFRLLCATWA